MSAIEHATADDPKRAAARLPLADGFLAFYDRHRVAFLVTLVLFYLAGFNAQWHMEPDSALYLSIARNLAEGRGYTFQGQLNTLAYPGWPYLLAGLFKVFGPNTLWPAHIFMLGCALAALALFYHLMRLHAGRPTAVLMTCMVGMSETVYRYAFELRNDMPFLVAVLAFLAGWEALQPRRSPSADAPMSTSAPGEPAAGAARPSRAWHVLLLVGGLVLAMVMRPAAIALIVAIVAAASWSVLAGKPGRRRRMLVLALAVMILATLWAIDPRRRGGAVVGTYESLMVRALSPSTVRIILHDHLPRLLEPVLADAALGTRVVWAWLDRAVGVVLIALGFWLLRRRPLWGLFVIATLVMIVAVPATEPVYKPESRYVLPVLPLLAYGWWLMLCRISRGAPGRWGQSAFVILLALWVVPNVARVGWVLIGQRSVPFLAHYEDGDFAQMPALAAAIRQNVHGPAPVLVRSRRGHILSYLSDRDVRDGSAIRALAGPDLTDAYVILPEPDDEHVIADFLAAHRLVVSRPLASIPRPHAQPWTLRRAVSAAASATQTDSSAPSQSVSPHPTSPAPSLTATPSPL